MGNLINKYPSAYSLKITRLSTISLFISLSSAFVGTIWALYLDGFLESISNVAILTGFLSIISFFSYFLFIPLVQKSDKGKLFMISLFIGVLSYVAFAFISNFYAFILIALVFTASLTIRISTFGLILKDCSKKSNLSENEGLRYTFSNVAFVIGPLLAGYLLSLSGVRDVFILSAITVLLGMFLFWRSNIIDKNKTDKVNSNLFDNFISFFRGRDRIFVYLLRGGVAFWWGLIYLFIPLYIIRSGLDKSYVGYFLFAVALPLIFFEYSFSKFAARKGFKLMFFLGFSFAGLIAVVCFFVSNVLGILVLLVIASFGLAMLEPTTETYFFDILNFREGHRFYGPFNTSGDLGSFLSRFLGGLILLVLPFEYIFLFFAGGMFLMAIISLKARDVIEKK